MPSAECRRLVLYSSIHAGTPARAAALVGKCSTERSSNSKVACQDSMTAALPAVGRRTPFDLGGSLVVHWLAGTWGPVLCSLVGGLPLYL